MKRAATYAENGMEVVHVVGIGDVVAVSCEAVVDVLPAGVHHEL